MKSFGKKIQYLFDEYKHLLLTLYFLIYMPWFAFVEKTVTKHFHVIHMKIDDYIPFCEYFIVPYLLWFFYIAVVYIYMALTNKKDFGKMCAFLYTGMTIFLIVSTIYPNGHFLRPDSFERDNIFTQLCAWLYQTDTSTNIFPSIHVFNSVGVHLAIIYNDKLKKNKFICISSAILMVSIVLSTVLLKQHSLFDVITALGLAAILHQLIYARNSEKVRAKADSKVRIPQKANASQKELPQI